MASFGLTWEQVADDMLGARTWAMHAWAVENEARLMGASLKRVGRKGYVRRQIDTALRKQTNGG